MASSLFEYSLYSYDGNHTQPAGNSLAQFIPLSIAYGLVFVTGVIGNSIVLLSIYKSRRLHTITCIFLANMAIVDLIVCLLIVPLQFYQEFMNYWPYGEAMCKLISYLTILNPTCSVFTLTLISFERFYVVLYPLQAKAVLTFRRAKMAVLVVWICAILFTLPAAFKQGVVSNNGLNYCKSQWGNHSVEQKIYATGNMLFLLVIPVVMMTLAYTSVTLALYKNKRATAGRKQSSPGRSVGDVRYQNGATRLQVHPNDEFSSTSTAMSDASPARRIVNDENCNKEDNRSKRLRFRIGGAKEQTDADDDKIKRIVLMLIVIVLLFVISWAPLLTVNFLLKFAIINPYRSYDTIAKLSTSTHLLAYGNSCFNPFVYALLSKNFREGTKQVLRQCCICRWCGGTDKPRFQHRPSLSSTRFSRLGSSIPRWKSIRSANESKEDYV